MKPQLNTPLNNQHGYALVLSLLILALLSSLGVAAMYQSNTEVAVVNNERVGNRLLMAADSGVEFGNNQVWAQSGFGTNATVSFANLDNFFLVQAQANGPALPTALPLNMGARNLNGNTWYDVTIPVNTTNAQGTTVSGYDMTDASQRVVTFQARSWEDVNGNNAYDLGERSRMVTSRVSYQYGSLSFPYGMLTQNTECIFCHASIIGDVVSLKQINVKGTNKAYSFILGDVYSMGSTNLNVPDSRVVYSYTDQDGDLSTVENAGEVPVNVTTNYSDPDRFPIDANGNPSFPAIQNLNYYKGLAASFNGGLGSNISGGTVVSGVPANGTLAANLTALGSVSKSYSGNLLLWGTPGNCIQLNGPVVIEKDLVMNGCVTGQGALYVGGNIYVSGAITYTDSANDQLGLAAGGNIIIGDYSDTSNAKNTASDVGGGSYIKKQIGLFNADVIASATPPPGQRRLYVSDDGLVYDRKTAFTPSPGDTLVGYTPNNNTNGNPWMTESEYLNNYVDQANGVTQLDAMVYTANGIFGLQRRGTKQMTINGALVSADIGILIPGANGKSKNYDPANIGLTLVYDSRMENFLSVARNPTRRTLSWKEGA